MPPPLQVHFDREVAPGKMGFTPAASFTAEYLKAGEQGLRACDQLPNKTITVSMWVRVTEIQPQGGRRHSFPIISCNRSD